MCGRYGLGEALGLLPGGGWRPWCDGESECEYRRRGNLSRGYMTISEREDRCLGDGSVVLVVGGLGGEH